jgi:uncharacterized protein (DUF885 family)
MRRAVILACLLFSASAAHAAPADDLKALVDRFEAYDRVEDPMTAGLDGDRAALGRLPDPTREGDARRLKQLNAFAAELTAIQPDGLSPAQRFDRDFLMRMIDDRVRRDPFDDSRLALDAENGPSSLLGYLGAITHLRTDADAEAYLARLAAAPAYVDAVTANARRGIKSGFVQPRATVDNVLPVLKTMLAQPIDEHALLGPLKSAPQAVRDKYLARARDLVERQVRPAEQRFADMLEKEYRPKARATLGASSLPGGRAYYAYLVRHFTTTDLTPDQIHALGLSEVSRLRGEMDGVIRETGFKGDFKAFQTWLRTDPRFYATSREDLLEKASEISKRIDDKLPGVFGTLPRLTYGVREVPRAIEETYTTGRYNPGSPSLGIAGGYMVNTSHLDQRPLYELPALSLHEAVPGHHLQIALSQELPDQPAYRRNADMTAFIEGWGLYAETVGYDLGTYRDAYERFGKLSYEMWRACRLVADTGLHWKGWSLEQARACFTDNTALAPHNIETELQRYIAWPGQALGYKIGELKFRELRKRAETALGPKFDLRQFHDVVLLGGPMPLDMLDARVDAWIKAR